MGLKALPMEPISRYEVRDELRRVLQDRRFQKARKRSRFLEFVCEQTLLGNGDKLNEYLIGVEVYERGPDFNPAEDAIVRVQAVELRRALKDYYANEGKDDPWRIELPAGHYLAVFARAPAPAAPQPAAATLPQAPPPAPGPARHKLVIAVLGAACVALAAVVVWQMAGSPRTRLSFPAAASWFWKPFLPPADPPLIVIPNHPLLRAAHEGDPPSTVNRSFRVDKEAVPAFRDTMHFRELSEFLFIPDTKDFTGIGEAVGLVNLFELFAGAGQKMVVKQARLVDFDALKHGNAILLGGNQPWSGRIFLYPDGFRFHIGGIVNVKPRPGERPFYKAEFDPVTNNLRLDYALILMLPNENRDERILLTYGIYTQGTQAAMEYVTSPGRLADLRNQLAALSPERKAPPKYFEVLISTKVENDVPGQVSFVAARAIPEP